MRKTVRSSLTARLLAVAGGAALCLSAASALYPTDAIACGCFAPPDPSVPIVQAGERILFAQSNGQVTAYIQVQYSGKPGEFGWLLPLPAVPKTKAGTDGIDVGVDELFSQLLATTQPKYRLTRVYDECGNNPSRNSPTAAFGTADSGAPSPQSPPSPLVVQDSVGPYDYAVLKADNKDLMVKWLNDNHYFIPTGTLDAAAPYLHPGAFFLALRLKAGLAAGDLQPVVLHYQSDLPMIPIILTSVAAQPNMGVQVWMLGAGRAIPRNYYHTVINDSQIDWLHHAEGPQPARPLWRSGAARPGQGPCLVRAGGAQQRVLRQRPADRDPVALHSRAGGAEGAERLAGELLPAAWLLPGPGPPDEPR